MPVQANSLTVTWIPGDGSTRVAYINTNGTFVAPANNTIPTANAVWQNAGQQAVYVGTGNQVTITGLTQDTTYHLRVYEFNSDGVTTLYLTTTAVDNPNSVTTLSLLPTVQDSLIGFSNIIQHSAIISWTLGDASTRVVYINSVNSFTNPINGTVPTQNTVWQNAGQQAIYVGNSNSVTVTGLSPSTVYYVRIYGFNGTGANATYLTTTATGNPNNFTTAGAVVATPPTIQDSTIIFSGFTNNLMTITWSKGNGENRVLYLNTSSTFTNPTNGVVPAADSSWNGAGQQAAYVGKGNGVQVTGLSPGVTYFARVYGFNGSGPTAAYNTTGAASAGQQLFTAVFGQPGNPIPVPGVASLSLNLSLLVDAIVSSSPLSITIRWTSYVAGTSYTIYRKVKGAASWGTAIATLPGSATQYIDSTVSEGVYYEYRIDRPSSLSQITPSTPPGLAVGYIATGINVPVVDDRGKILLLVDNFYSTSLSAEITQLEDDLIGDSWRVIRADYARSATVSTIKSFVSSQYAADAAQVKAVYILGHLAVPYSGFATPDGHPPEHRGAWPCDAYYADVNGVWTDSTVNVTTTSPSNVNVPGDGKFDQSTIPTPVELEIGRVDLFNLPAFAANDTELTRNYLNKAHEHKSKLFTSPDRAMLLDNLQFTDEPLCETGWRTIGHLVGSNNVVQIDGGQFQTRITQGHTWATTANGGDYTQYPGLTGGSTANYAVNPFNALFNTSLGSYFGDWNNQNNLLRSPLASGRALTNCWVGLPRWIFHHFAFSDNIGYSVKTTHNSTGASPGQYPTNQLITYDWNFPQPYPPQNLANNAVNMHLALMGDPTLRVKYVEMPTDFQILNTGGALSFSWTAANDDKVLGYHIYRVGNTTTPHTRITPTPIIGATATSIAIGGAVSGTAGTRYMVKSVRLETNRSGSFFNTSLGAIASVP